MTLAIDRTTTPRTYTYTFKAIRMEQSGIPLYVGVAKAGELIKVAGVDYYDSDLAPDDPNQGYQRPPERSRITKIGKYLMTHGGDGLFPNAVLLSARYKVDYDPKYHEITVSSDHPLQIVDGQHRMSGFKYAIEEKGKTGLGNYNVPFVVMQVQSKIIEMQQFAIVNGTAKSVPTDLVNQILTATVAERGEDEIKEKDRWKVVVTRVVSKLDNEPSSPWHNLILMADEVGTPEAREKVVRATSFMTSLRPVYEWMNEFDFQGSHTLEDRANRLYEVVASYWRAIQEVVPEPFAAPDAHVIQKTPGLFSLHKLLRELLRRTFLARMEWNTENFVRLISESPEITDANYWRSKNPNGAGRYGSMKGFDELYDILLESIDPRT